MHNVLGRRVCIAVITIAAFLPVNGAYGQDAVPWKQLSRVVAMGSFNPDIGESAS